MPENEVPVPEGIRPWLSHIGKIKTAKKAEASRRNGRLHGGRPFKPLAEIPCSCAAGDALEGHKTYCLRGQAIRRRQKAGKL